MNVQWVKTGDGRYALVRGEQEIGTIRRYEYGRGWRVTVRGLPKHRANLADAYRRVEFYEGCADGVTYPGVVKTKALAGHAIRRCRSFGGATSPASTRRPC